MEGKSDKSKCYLQKKTVQQKRAEHRQKLGEMHIMRNFYRIQYWETSKCKKYKREWGDFNKLIGTISNRNLKNMDELWRITSENKSWVKGLSPERVFAFWVPSSINKITYNSYLVILYIETANYQELKINNYKCKWRGNSDPQKRSC